MMTPIKNVLIVGGGIGGLTLAVALRQRQVGVDLVEIKREHKVFGVGIIQPGNALRALKTLGLMQQCMDAGFQIDKYSMRDQDGEFIAQMRLLRIADRNIPAINGIPRMALHDILSHTARDAGANIRLGVTVKAIDQQAEGATAVFTDGSSGTYDLIVGADGLRSATRESLFGHAYDPVFTGHGVWRFTTSRPPEVDHQIMYFGVGAKAGLMPVAKDQMYLLLVTNEPGNPWMETERLHHLLRERLAQFTAPEIRDIRSQITDPSQVIYGPVEEVVLPNPWYKGRVLLIGDAAHASSPHVSQGATMAMEDAVVLADLIAEGENYRTTLDRFMKRRYERCKFVQDVSRQVGIDGNLSDPDACRLRNQRMRETFADPQPRPHELRMAEPI